MMPSVLIIENDLLEMDLAVRAFRDGEWDTRGYQTIHPLHRAMRPPGSWGPPNLVVLGADTPRFNHAELVEKLRKKDITGPIALRRDANNYHDESHYAHVIAAAGSDGNIFVLQSADWQERVTSCQELLEQQRRKSESAQ
jgi:hypothetical protein